VNYEGEIREINLVERLIELWRDQFTGAIRFENDGIIKIVYVKGGDILSASTNDRADSVDEILMRAGKVSKEHVKQALTKRKENETLGDALLHLGFITRKELIWARRIQVINVIRSIEAWESGSFTVVADYLPKREEGTIFPLPQVIVEMIVTDQDRGKYERLLDSGAAVFTKTAGHDEIFRKLGLNEDAEAVMAQVDGERQATEVAAASRQDTFDAFKLLHALSILGILERKSEAVPALAAQGFETAGVADAADAWGGGNESPEPKFQFDDITPQPSFDAAEEISIAPVPGLADPLTSPSSLPTWDSAPAEEPTPSLSAVETPSLAPEPDEVVEEIEGKTWGFDEAQVETARKATDAQSTPLPPGMPPVFLPTPPVPPATPRTHSSEGSRRGIASTATRRTISPPKRKSSRPGLLLGIIAIFVLGAVGYYAFRWWQGREAAIAQPVAPAATTAGAAPIATPVEMVPPAMGTIVPVTETNPPAVTTTTAPPAVATPTKATPIPAPSQGDRARYEAMAREFAANPAGNFTVQFAIVCEPSNVAKALRTSSDVWFSSITLKGRSCFRMFWGRYATRAEAEAAMRGLPGELRESRPAVVGVPR
jgi:septal ring-binding cell division protein DamX